MSKFKVGDKVKVISDCITNDIYKIYDIEIRDGVNFYSLGGYNIYTDDDLELYKTPHQRLLDLGFIIDDETNYFIGYVFNGLEITIYKKEKVYQTYVFGDYYNPINLELAEILVDYLKELENES